MGFDIDNPGLGRDRHAVETAGKRLFVLVRMQQDTLAQFSTRVIDHSPGIGVVFPTRVAVLQRGRDVPSIAAKDKLRTEI